MLPGQVGDAPQSDCRQKQKRKPCAPANESGDVSKKQPGHTGDGEDDASLPQFPGKGFPAAVVSYSHAIDAKSQTLLVELNADNPDGALQPGSSGQVEFQLPSNP